ncbi:glutathione S-transferase Mu 5-like [Muntiacus reevesi]|uniref:glutathione S-transferase Mu 5-like n=1 Tax=Muntiacus reevesi TaxID=9886 RepID=UPI003307B4ED
MAMTLGYWQLHRLAHVVRLLLECTNSNYEEKYRIGDSPNYDRSQWLSKKFKLGLDFPNLLYLINGAHKLTQSKATLDSTAHEHNVSGETEKICMAVMENRARDTANDLVRVCHRHHSEKMKSQYLKEIPENMKLYSEVLGTRTWFAGDKLTYGLRRISAYISPAASSHTLYVQG